MTFDLPTAAVAPIVLAVAVVDEGIARVSGSTAGRVRCRGSDRNTARPCVVNALEHGIHDHVRDLEAAGDVAVLKGTNG